MTIQDFTKAYILEKEKKAFVAKLIGRVAGKSAKAVKAIKGSGAAARDILRADKARFKRKVRIGYKQAIGREARRAEKAKSMGASKPIVSQAPKTAKKPAKLWTPGRKAAAYGIGAAGTIGGGAYLSHRFGKNQPSEYAY